MFLEFTLDSGQRAGYCLYGNQITLHSGALGLVRVGLLEVLSGVDFQAIGGMSLGIINKLLEPYAGAVLGKILVLVVLILFIQRRPRGLFPQVGRAAEGMS